MDGYIKNKKEAIASVKKTIFSKYAITFFILISVPVWLFALAANQPPEKWTHTEVRFSHISRERVGLQSGYSYVLNAQDGRKFVIKSKYVDVTNLSDNLVPGNTYFLVFSDTIAGGDHMEALFDEIVVFQDVNDSILQWEREQQEVVVAIIVTLVTEVVAVILIDGLWCKKEYSKIGKLKADIKRREDRINDK